MMCTGSTIHLHTTANVQGTQVAYTAAAAAADDDDDEQTYA